MRCSTSTHMSGVCEVLVLYGHAFYNFFWVLRRIQNLCRKGNWPSCRLLCAMHAVPKSNACGAPYYACNAIGEEGKRSTDANNLPARHEDENKLPVGVPPPQPLVHIHIVPIHIHKSNTETHLLQPSHDLTTHLCMGKRRAYDVHVRICMYVYVYVRSMCVSRT